MPRQPRPVPTARGGGTIAVSVPVAALLEASGIGVNAYLDLVRDGMLDTARRQNKFTSEPSAVAKLRKDYGRELPEGLPDLAGDVSWRRVPQRWSLDVNHGMLGQGVHWWEQIARGTGDAQLKIENVTLPDTVTMRMPGRPLCEFIEHPTLGDERIVIRTVRCYAAHRFNGRETAACIELKLDVPRLVFPD